MPVANPSSNQADALKVAAPALTQIPTQASLANSGSLGNNGTQSKPDVSNHGNGDNDVNEDAKSVGSGDLDNGQAPVKEVETMRQKSFDLDGALSPLQKQATQTQRILGTVND